MLPEDYCGMCGLLWPDCRCGLDPQCPDCDLHVEDCDCPEEGDDDR